MRGWTGCWGGCTLTPTPRPLTHLLSTVFPRASNPTHPFSRKGTRACFAFHSYSLPRSSSETHPPSSSFVGLGAEMWDCVLWCMRDRSVWCGVQVGGATARIGDPSGRSTERNAMDGEAVDRNAVWCCVDTVRGDSSMRQKCVKYSEDGGWL
jgi:hypothetical protein